MSVCFNRRKPVSLSAESCPYCGIGYTRGTLRSPLSGIAPSESGWGFASGVLKNRLYQWAALLLPFWGPVVVGALGGNAPITGLFFSPFLLIPGLHLIGNRPAWRGMTRLAACLAYVAACVSLWIVILMSLRV